MAYVLTGNNFTDALATGPVAGDERGTNPARHQGHHHRTHRTELARLGPKSIIISGGTGVISTTVEAQLAT